MLALSAHSAEEKPEFAAGAHGVLNHQPDLPQKGQSSAALKDILARPEYLVQPPSPPPQSLLDRIAQWIAKHLPALGGIAAAGSTATIVITVAVVLLLVLLIYAIVRLMWQRMSRTDPASYAVDEARLDAAGLLDLAQRAASAGDYRSALRLRFRAVVSRLGVLDADWKTNWQLLKLVRREHPDAARSFADLTALFEDCWYGGAMSGATEYERAAALARSVETALVVREAAA